jgi:Kef-type K+ transport system membrane component KefB
VSGDIAFLEALGIITIAAAFAAFVGRLVRMPTIVSYVLAGLVVGPIAGWIPGDGEAHGALDVLAEMGVVLLLFLVGLELSIERIRAVGKVAFAAGIGQVLFTTAGGLGLAYVLGFGWLDALFIATALTFSSTVVVVKLLDQKGDLHSLYGRIAIGIFLVQDLVVIVILTVLSGLGRAEALTPGAIATNIGMAFGGMTVLLAGVMVAARFVLPSALSWAVQSPRLLLIASLSWCTALVVAAEALELSVEIGAFLAGIALAQHSAAHDLRRRTHPLMMFFVVVFFVTLGAQMELTAAGDYWFQALVLSLFVLIGNPFIFMLIIARFGYSERTSFSTSVTVAQISEFSFIFAALGVTTGLIHADILSIVAMVGIVTIAASAYMILYSEPLYARISRWGLLRIFRAGHHEDEELGGARLRDHVVVVGMNDIGRRVVHALCERGEQVVAIDSDARLLRDLPSRCVTGDVEYESTLDDACLDDAKLAITTFRGEAAGQLFAYRCTKAGVPVATYALDRPIAEQFERAGADRVVESRAISGQRLAEELVELGVLGGKAS